MKFCEAHWSELRTAVQTRGLAPLIAPNGPEAARRLQAWTNGHWLRINYDPLMSAHMEILRKAVERWKATVLKANGCPVCRNREKTATWIQDATQREYVFALGKGWVSAAPMSEEAATGES